MLTRGPALLLPIVAIFGMTDIILEADADPKVHAQREDIRAFYARLVLTLAITVVGSYLSLHQLAKSYQMFNDKRNRQLSSGDASEPVHILDHVLSSPICIVEIGVIFLIGIDYSGGAREFASYCFMLFGAFLGTVPISSLILFSMPVARKLQEVKIISMTWTGHDRAFNALDFLSFCVSATISFTQFFCMINANGVLFTIGML